MQNFFWDHIAAPFCIVCTILALAGFGYVGFTLLTLEATQSSGTNSRAMIATPPQSNTGGGVASAATPGNSPTAQPTPAQSQNMPNSSHATPNSSQNTPVSSQPTQPPAQPTQAPTQQPSPSPYIQPGVNGNPWGYDFSPGSVITQPPAQFCQYFQCIPSFWQGSGYVEECNDGMYSLSGGIQGSCSYHKGDWRVLYQHH